MTNNRGMYIRDPNKKYGKDALLTLEERMKIQKYNKQNLSGSGISKLIGRGKNTILVELRRFKQNHPDISYDPKIAHKDAQERIKKGYEKVSLFNTGKTREKNIDKIESLQMQIDILLDQIRELKNGV